MVGKCGVVVVLGIVIGDVVIFADADADGWWLLFVFVSTIGNVITKHITIIIEIIIMENLYGFFLQNSLVLQTYCFIYNKYKEKKI